MGVMRRFRSLISLLLLAMVGWACSRPAPETSTLDVPTEIVPGWVNPSDMESVFPDGTGCMVAAGDGVRILQVLEGVGAYGVLRAGDIITSVDGAPTSSREGLLSMLDGRNPGDSLRIAGTRAGAPFSAEVELTAVPEDPERPIIGIIPETKLRVAHPSELPTSDTADPLGHPVILDGSCLLYTSPSPRDGLLSRMPSSA